MNPKYIILIFALLILFSCKKKTKYEYYESGKLKYEEHFLSNKNETVFYVKKYYLNGKIEHEGLIRNDSIREGKWKMYFGDGELRWEGNFKNSVIQHQQFSKNWTWPNMKQYFKGLEIKGNPKRLIKDSLYYFRVIMPQIHPNLYAVVDSNFQVCFSNENQDTFQFKMQPKKSGIYQVNIVFVNKDGVFLIGNPALQLGYSVYEK